MKITSQNGFTLIELIVVIVILAILSAISLPSFQSTIISNRMTTEINALVSDLHFAKTEAIKRSRNISLCAANDNASGCSDSSNWGVNGWLVVDGEEVLRISEPVSSSDTLLELGVTGNSGLVSFNRYGFTAGSARSFVLCGPFGNDGVIKGAVVTTAGRIRNASDHDADGVVEYIDFTVAESDETKRDLAHLNMEC